MMKILRSFGLLSLFLVFGLLATNKAFAAVRTWDGEGATENWSEAANWSANTIPGDADTALFDGTSSKSATIDASYAYDDLGALQIDAAYGGTITLAKELSIYGYTQAGGTFSQGASILHIGSNPSPADFIMTAGTFTGGSAAIEMNNAFNISGTASFTSTTGTLSLEQNFTVGAGASFSPSTGTVSLFRDVDATVDVDGTETFYRLTIAKVSNHLVTIAAGDTLVTTDQMNLTTGEITGGTLDVQGSFSNGGGFANAFGFHSTTDIQVDGGGAQSIVFTGGSGHLPQITINNASATVTGPASSAASFTDGTGVTFVNGSWDWSAGTGEVDTVNWSQSGGTVTAAGMVVRNPDDTEERDTFEITGGTFTATDDQITINGDVYIGASGTMTAPDASGGANLQVDGDWTLIAGGTFTPNGGKVLFVPIDSILLQIINGSTTFYDLEIDGSFAADTTLELETGETETVANTLRIAGFGEFNRVLLIASTGGVPAFFDVTDVAGSSFYAVDVTDNHNVSGTDFDCTDPLNLCTDNGGNLGWDFGGGGGGGGGGAGSGGPDVPVYVTDEFVEVADGAVCSPYAHVTVSVGANGGYDYIVADTLAELAEAEWQRFSPNSSRGGVPMFPFGWTLPAGEGTHTVYAQVRSSTGDLSDVVSDSIIRDSSTCDTSLFDPGSTGDIAYGDSEGPYGDTSDPSFTLPPIPVDEEYKPPVVEVVPPVVEEPVAADDVLLEGGRGSGYFPSSRFVRTADDATVYFIDDEGVYHPFLDIESYLTYTDAADAVDYVDPSVIAGAEIGSPMLPRPESVLLRFDGDREVYAIEPGPTEGSFILRLIPTEEIAAEIYGADWELYVLSVRVDPRYVYTFGSPLTGLEEGLITNDLYSAAALRGTVTYDIYIINPDGTRRSIYSDFGRKTALSSNIVTYSFEDNGSDMDYNDVVMKVDTSDYFGIRIDVESADALWHHQIGVAVFYEGEPVFDQILWEDSHTSLKEVKLIDLSNLDRIEHPATVPETSLQATQKLTALQTIADFIAAVFHKAHAH